ncbi:large conductance mechanosensitive channel protein MscL [Granulosicoccaceae sp. 1_MG-2023]|nr:large conductance mechanosensitive channel protein MscL [Granulosicoccaceae sp. 1_MG-2023]
MFKEFKEFAMGGNVIDMAVGIIIGAAFGTIVNSLVADIIMPPIGVLIGGIDFSNLFVTIKEGATAGPYSSIKAAADAGAVTINYGQFLNHVISFLVVAFSIFLVVRSLNKMRKQEAEAPAEPPRQEVLLEEIRDLLKRS